MTQTSAQANTQPPAGAIAPDLCQALWEHSPVGLWVVAVLPEPGEFQWVAVNGAIAPPVATPVAEAIGKTLTASLAPALAQFYRQALQACVTQQQVITLEQERPQASQQSEWWQLAIAPLPSPAKLGAPIEHLLVTVVDISPVKQAATQLQQRLSFLNDILDNTTDAIFVKDWQGYYTLANATTLRIFGLPEAAVIGKTDEELLPPEIASAIIEVDRRVMTDGTSEQFEEAVLDQQTGGIVTYETTKTPLRDQAGGVIGLVGIAKNVSDRKRAEAARDRSERNLRTIFDHVNDAIFVYDTEAKLLDVNHRMLALYGLRDRATALRWSVVDYSAPDNPLEQLSELWARAQAGERVQFEWKCQRPGDGSCFDGEITLNKITLDEHEAILVSVQDVSDRKAALRAREQVETSLRRSEERFQAFMDHSPTAAWLVSQTGEMLYINKKYLEMFTLPTSDIVGKNLFDLYPAAAAAEFLQNIRTVAKHHQLVQTIEPIPLPDGSMGDSLVYKFPIGDLAGPDVVGGIAIDVTDQRRAAAVLRDYGDRQALLNQITNQVRDSLDLETVITTALQAIRNLLEIDNCAFAWYRPETDRAYWEIIQEARDEAVPSTLGAYDRRLVGPLTEIVQGQTVVWIDNAAEYAEPQHRAFLQSIHCQSELLLPIRTHSQQLGMLICANYQALRPWTTSEVELLTAVGAQLAIAIDQAELYAQTRQKQQALETMLNELHRTQAQMVQSEKMSSLGQLVAGIAHEINNPVNFIHGNLSHAGDYTKDLLELVDLYQSEYPRPSPLVAELIEAIDLDFIRDDLPKLLRSMQIGTDRIREIVKSLRLFSRLDESEVKPINIHEGIDSTLMILHNRIKAKAHRKEIQIIKQYGALPLVECYAGQLNQVFMNILANAIDALEDHAHHNPTAELAIMITTTRLGTDQVEIAIADNGSGMPESVQQQIFDPFFTTKPIGKGTGMGLSISHQIVTERHQGKLVCCSTAGEGTQFKIQIPLRQS